MVATPQQKQPLPAGSTKLDWMDYLLQRLGVPDTNTNRATLFFWTLSEDSTGNFNGANNPLAICGASCPGVVGCVAQCGPGNCPISKYSTLQEGLDCTAMFILGSGTSARGNSGPLKGIMSSLYNGMDNADGTPNVNHMAINWTAINQSGWCAGCQGGKYPNALFAALGKDGASIIKSVSGGAAGGLGPGTPDIPTLPQIGAAVGKGAEAVGKAVTAPIAWAEGLAKLLSVITSVKFWKRVGLGTLGVALMVLGFILILSETKVGQTVESAAVVAAAA